MSSSHHPSPDSIITVKVNYDGSTRRAKMPLRDTAQGVLEDQLRGFLHIPDDVEVVIERYSDSAAAYVVLEPGNTAVYKQLYRAAKAKSKLKFRVSPKVKDEGQNVDFSNAPFTAERSSARAYASVVPGLETLDVAHHDYYKNPPAPPVSLPMRHASLMSRLYESSLLSEAAKIAESSDVRREFYARAASNEASRDSQTVDAPAETRDESADETPEEVALPECPNFAICCNSCDETTSGVHYHCSTCDDGDFDLCQACVDNGIACYGSDHWLIKRTKVDGQIVASTTETIAPRPKPEAAASQKPEDAASIPPAPKPSPTPLRCLGDELVAIQAQNKKRLAAMAEAPEPSQVPKPSLAPLPESPVRHEDLRTCNSCVMELPESQFIHCMDCDDYDLCTACFPTESHAHHPRHAFAPVVPGSITARHITSKLPPGRNQVHHAICDNCDKYITGVRHKCLDCPDWDYCASCASDSDTIHPGHRFVPIYEPIKPSFFPSSPLSKMVHVGICCDGPLCADNKVYPAYIYGARYKCAVCPDLDFCARCEAHPSNTHDVTHPLIKLRSPVRHVDVTTFGELPGGEQMPAMGDAAAATTGSTLSLNVPQTVVDTKPQPLAPAAESQEETEPAEPTEPTEPTESAAVNKDAISAIFVCDSIRDGTIMPAKKEFEQTWTLRNVGETAWPAGCSVRFVGGDYMGRVDSTRPARTAELIEASESNACPAAIGPGETFDFSVKLRTPPRPCRAVSYWRATAPDGTKFGDRLWCDISVRELADEPAPEVATSKAGVTDEKQESDVESSQMIFPKLENESPKASAEVGDWRASTEPEGKSVESEDFTEWDGNDEDFLTDEEYDILDASDEEFLEDQGKKLRQ